VTTCGISSSFPELFHASGQVTNALLTRSPLRTQSTNTKSSSFDLHVLGTPPALILSQDQTLRKNYASFDADLRSKKELGSINFLSLFNCQGTTNEAGRILPASFGHVKAFVRQKTDISYPDVGTSDRQVYPSLVLRIGLGL
jgi:hypothetical protein